MVFDSYDSGNSSYFYKDKGQSSTHTPLPIEIYTTKELCEELKKRVEAHGTEILGDFADWIAFYRSCELLAEASKGEDVT